MFTQHRIVFRSVLQYYAALCEHTFFVNIIFMCFDGKNNHLKKKKNARESSTTIIERKNFEIIKN